MEGPMNPALHLPAEDVRILEHMRTRLHPISTNLQHLLVRLNRNPELMDWSFLARQTEVLKSQLKSLYDYINTPIEHNHETVIRDGKEVTVGDILSSLAAYPISPYPTTSEGGWQLLNNILVKKPNDDDELYIKRCIEAAAEFCRVPDTWDIERPKPVTQDDEDENEGEEGDGSEDPYGGVKRVTTHFDEDEISDLWVSAAQGVAETYELFEKVMKETEDRDEETQESLDEIDRLRYQVNGDEEEETEAETPKEGEQDVQQTPLADQPPLPLGTLLKFMSTGETNR